MGEIFSFIGTIFGTYYTFNEHLLNEEMSTFIDLTNIFWMPVV